MVVPAVAALNAGGAAGTNDMQVDVRDGAVYLPAALVARHFPGVDVVAVLVRDGDLHVLPLQGAQFGGCLLKIRNRAGDRVAAAPDVFAAHGLMDWRVAGLAVRWSVEAGALLLPLPSSAAGLKTKFAV
jgi:hypothetical protein